MGKIEIRREGRDARKRNASSPDSTRRTISYSPQDLLRSRLNVSVTTRGTEDIDSEDDLRWFQEGEMISESREGSRKRERRAHVQRVGKNQSRGAQTRVGLKLLIRFFSILWGPGQESDLVEDSVGLDDPDQVDGGFVLIRERPVGGKTRDGVECGNLREFE